MCKSIPAGFDFDLVLHIKNAHSQELSWLWKQLESGEVAVIGFECLVLTSTAKTNSPWGETWRDNHIWSQ